MTNIGSRWASRMQARGARPGSLGSLVRASSTADSDSAKKSGSSPVSDRTFGFRYGTSAA